MPRPKSVQEPPVGLIRLVNYRREVSRLSAPRRGSLLRAVLSWLRGALS